MSEAALAAGGTMDPAPERDAAWVKLALPMAPAALSGFLRDIELVLRINPCIEFERLDRMPDGGWQLSGRNDSNGQSFDTVAEFDENAGGSGLELHYASGIKRMTRFDVAPDPDGCVMTITESYNTPGGEEQERRLAEVDRSLTPWAAALRTHLLRRARWGGMPGYHWLAERFWFGMPPRQRRVARMIIWATLLEFVVFVAVLAVFVAG